MTRLATTAAPFLCALLVLACSTSTTAFGLTSSDPGDGDVLKQPPERVRLCFSEPVNVAETPDWRFTMRTPGGTALGLRIEVESDANCLGVFGGIPAVPEQGTWNVDWLIHAQGTGAEASGSVAFRVDANANDGAGVLAIALVGIAGAVVTFIIGGAVMLVRRRAATCSA